MDTKTYIKKVSEIHKNKYDYSKAVYKRHNLPIIIICKQHGDFSFNANNHLLGMGCPYCKMKGNTYFYFIKLENSNETFYKIGVTKDFKKRYVNFPYEITILFYRQMPKWFAHRLEKDYLKIIHEKGIHYTPNIEFGGWTECFKQ